MTLAISVVRTCEIEYLIMMWREYPIVILGRLNYQPFLEEKVKKIP
jgi:hypothetical protein